MVYNPAHKFFLAFGLGKSEAQANFPPVLGWMGAAAIGVASGAVAEVIMRASGYPLMAGILLRSIGAVAVVLTLHGLWRTVVHGDNYSLGGWFRNLWLR